MSWAEVRSALAAAERWLLPPECLLCRDPVDPELPGPLVCGACRSRWSHLPHPLCPRCGQPLTPGMACRLCTGWPPGFGGVRSAVWLEGGARQVVHLLKYGGWRGLAGPMARVMLREAPIPPAAVLVPVPLGAARERARGYNQSAELAMALGRLSGNPVAAMLLRRHRETRTQTALTPEERRANLRGAFTATGRNRGPMVLVDDVFTTGATLVEAAEALAECGAGPVSGITFARAPRPLAGQEDHSTGSRA